MGRSGWLRGHAPSLQAWSQRSPPSSHHDHIREVQRKGYSGGRLPRATQLGCAPSVPTPGVCW